MQKGLVACIVFVVAVAAGRQTMLAGQSSTPLVRVTPLGSHAGELCVTDRAMLFEDPTGIRILYDPGRTVDENDARLGDVHVMLLSHVHSDHIGDVRPSRGGGTCAAPANSGANPNSNFAAIAAVKRAAVIAGPDAAVFLNTRIQNVRGAATPGCPTSGPENETIVPAPSVCTAGLNFGSMRMMTRAGAGSVRIAVVPAIHTNAIPAQYIDPPGLPPGVLPSAGPPVGFIVIFSNGASRVPQRRYGHHNGDGYDRAALPAVACDHQHERHQHDGAP